VQAVISRYAMVAIPSLIITSIVVYVIDNPRDCYCEVMM